MPKAFQSHVAMRRLLIATVIGLATLAGQAAGAVELPELPSMPLAPEAPPVEAPTAPSLETPPVEAPPLEAPALPAVEPPIAARSPIEGVLPEEATRAPFPFDPANLPLPDVEQVAATTAVGGLLALVGFALYSRLSRGQLLDHERRDEVFQLVRAEPGISLTDIAQRTGLGWGTAVYHLDRLERGGFLMSERNGGRRCYFPVGRVPKDARPSLGALQQETTRNVASFVVERPGATQTELADALGMTPSAASKQVSKLESIGLLRREREWKTVRLHPEPKLSELLTPSAATQLAA